MAVDTFLKLSNGVVGEAKDNVHAGEIDVLSWSWGMSQSGTGHMGGGSGGGKVNVQDLTITKYVDSSSSDIMVRCAKGEHFENAKLIIRKAGGNTPVEYFHINMSHVFITSYQTGGAGSGDDKFMETISLNFAQVETAYVEQAEDGTAKPEATFAWDISTNAEWNGGPGTEGF